jgi:hypothetical protein
MRLLLGGLLVWIVAGCSGGFVTIVVDGGIAATDGIPANHFADGWSVRFDRWLVALADIAVTNGTNESLPVVSGPVVVDVVGGAATLLQPTAIAVGSYDAGLSVVPVSGNVGFVGATREDAALLSDNGWSLFVSGQAFLNDRVMSFQWGLDANTRYTNCRNPQGGIAISDGDTATWKVRVDPGALFADDLLDDASPLRFAALAAADANGDDALDDVELSAALLSELPADVASRYITGGAGDIVDLHDYLRAASRRTIGFQSDGACTPERR